MIFLTIVLSALWPESLAKRCSFPWRFSYTYRAHNNYAINRRGMEAETKEKGSFQPMQGHLLPRNPICVPNSSIRHDIGYGVLRLLHIWIDHFDSWLSINKVCICRRYSEWIKVFWDSWRDRNLDSKQKFYYGNYYILDFEGNVLDSSFRKLLTKKHDRKWFFNSKSVLILPTSKEFLVYFLILLFIQKLVDVSQQRYAPPDWKY